MSNEYGTESIADVYGPLPRAIDAMPSVGEAVVVCIVWSAWLWPWIACVVWGVMR